MTISTTAASKSELVSPSRRRALAGCASLITAAGFATRTVWSASIPAPQGDLFAFAAQRELVFALAVPSKALGQSEHDPFTVHLHAGASSWTVEPFALKTTHSMLPNGGHLFSGQISSSASNGDRTMARLIVVATPAERVPPGSFGVWAQIVSKCGARRRFGNPIVSQLMADDDRLAEFHALLHPTMDRYALSAAIARRIATRSTSGPNVEAEFRAKRLTELILPDTLRFDPARPSGFTFAAMNGRRVEDPIDPVVQTVLAGAPRAGRRAARYEAAEQFPYFAVAETA